MINGRGNNSVGDSRFTGKDDKKACDGRLCEGTLFASPGTRPHTPVGLAINVFAGSWFVFLLVCTCESFLCLLWYFITFWQSCLGNVKRRLVRVETNT